MSKSNWKNTGHLPRSVQGKFLKTRSELTNKCLEIAWKPELDTLLFAYQSHVSVNDGVIYLLQPAYSYLDGSSDFQYNSDSCHLQKFSDDTAGVWCIRGGQESEYRGLQDNFVDWCIRNYLLLNVMKTKDMGWTKTLIEPITIIGKGRELADVMERRKVDILCVQETRWKGSKARSIGAGFKLFYNGVDSKRNGVGVVLKEEFVRNVLEVKRVSDRVMSLKLEIEGVMLNVVSGYAPQVGCELEEKERFWSELDEVMESIPTGERVVIGADFNGHVGEGNTGDEEVMGKFGVKERNLEGQMVVDFAKRMDMAVVNTYFQKREEHRVTYKSGGRRTQVVLPDDWETTAEVIRETGRKVLGVSSGRRKEDKETWWWNEEVQDSIQRKRLAKKKWDMDRTEENRQEYKELQRRVKREVSKAKQKTYDELYTRLDTREGEKDLYRLARQRDRDGKDVQQEVDKIRKDEVRKALKRMKSGKAVGPDDIPVEVWKCLGEAAVEFLASLFNRVLENLEKAYDRVPREELWYCMRKSGVAEKYVRVVQDMYERSRTVVRCAVVMDQLSEEVRQESPWTMMFADDIVICSESREQVEENLERWRFALERRGMKVSRIQSNGECGKEVKKRVQAETVSLRKRQESELEVAELKMLRFSLGVTRLDRIRNEYIRGTAHVGRLGDKVREARLRWFGHVQRRERQKSGPVLKVISAVGVQELAQLLLVSPNLAVGFGIILRCEPYCDSQFLHEVGSHPRDALLLVGILSLGGAHCCFGGSVWTAWRPMGLLWIELLGDYGTGFELLLR
ncbi:hypothetical protein QTP86_001915 [Hemibagrus guttatus]|nr:hypothetical protein QTP86_001915 [Hemibagrus guttatus]